MPVSQIQGRIAEVLPQELFSEGKREQIVDVPARPIEEEIREAMQERTSEKIADRSSMCPFRRIGERSTRWSRRFPWGSVSERIVEKTVPHITEEMLAVIPMVVQERVSEYNAEDIIDVSTPHAMEEILEFVQLVPQDRAQNRTVELLVAASVPQIREELVEVIQPIPQERMSDRIVEQIVVMPAVVQQQAPVAQTMDESLHVSGRDKSTGRFNQIETTNEEQHEIDYMVKTGQEVQGQRKGEQGEGGR